MKTPVYDLLMYGDPQALNRLWLYQKRWYDKGIALPDAPLEPPVTLHSIIEPLEEIEREMAKARSRE